MVNKIIINQTTDLENTVNSLTGSNSYKKDYSKYDISKLPIKKRDYFSFIASANPDQSKRLKTDRNTASPFLIPPSQKPFVFKTKFKTMETPNQENNTISDFGLKKSTDQNVTFKESFFDDKESEYESESYYSGDEASAVEISDSDENKQVTLQEISLLAEMESLEKSIEAIDKLIASHHLLSDPSSDNFYFTPIVASRRNWSKTNIQTHQILTLTGKLKSRLIPPDASEELRKNLKAAKKIIAHVHAVVPFSHNYHQRSKILTSDTKYNADHLPLYQKIVKNSIDMNRYRSFTYIERIENTIEFKTGNCVEMSEVGFLYGKELHVPIELVKIDPEQGDHVFLIIGRNKKFKLANYKNWGPDAVICDVWAGSYFPASKIKYQMDYIELIHINKMQYTVVRRFDPSKQALHLIDSCG